MYPCVQIKCFAGHARLKTLSMAVRVPCTCKRNATWCFDAATDNTTISSAPRLAAILPSSSLNHATVGLALPASNLNYMGCIYFAGCGEAQGSSGGEGETQLRSGRCKQARDSQRVSRKCTRCDLCRFWQGLLLSSGGG